MHWVALFIALAGSIIRTGGSICSQYSMIEALQTHLALEYEFFETPADIVESAIFEMYTRMETCEKINEKERSL